MQGSLQLLTDLDQIREAFSIWRTAMEQQGLERDGLRWLPEGKICFRTKGNDFKLGLDPNGDNWTVELNEPTQGTENPLSGLARDSAGRCYLVRQGTLHKNAQSPRIETSEFEERIGLQPADVTINGSPAKRAWFVITPLDVSSTDICRNTAAFVDQCNLARDPKAAAAAKHDDERITELFGKPEQGGQIIGQPTINLNQRRRVHAEVWLALRARLKADGRDLFKPRHAQGYEVDGEIETQAGKLLLEIKTGTTAADVYAGIGQLVLYPKLLTRLSGYRRILLLPGTPRDPLIAAIRECGVELHGYELQQEGDEVHVTFSPQFLQLCNLGY